mmetsp:Transcript_38361/g.69518  ORF Transcript_38361/g.69518 Transcript_38361/m.69518 type:complete len:208 (+) Transcript_38361:365-988(+)
MVALQPFHVLDFKRLNEEIVESQQGYGIRLIEAQHEGLHVVSSLLQVTNVCRMLRIPNLYRPSLGIHPHLKLHVFHHRLDETDPGCLEWSHPVRWHLYSPQLPPHALLLWSESCELRLGVCFTFCILLDGFHHDVLYLGRLKSNARLSLLALSPHGPKSWLCLRLFLGKIIIAIHRDSRFDGSFRSHGCDRLTAQSKQRQRGQRQGA